MQIPISLVILKVVPPSPPTSIRSPEKIAMNEVSTEPIAQVTEDVTDVAENVESIDAPPVAGLAEPVQEQVSPTENVEQAVPIRDEVLPTEPIELVALIQDELIPFAAVADVTPVEDELVPAKDVEQVTPV